MLYTVQRPSDCLSMTTSRIREDDGRLYISLRQQKTGKLIDVPVHSALEPLLSSRALCHELGERGRERFLHEYTDEAVRSRFFAALETVVVEHEGRRGRARR